MAYQLGCRRVCGDGVYKFGLHEHIREKDHHSSQLYTLHMVRQHQSFPILYALTGFADTGQYKKIFKLFREACWLINIPISKLTLNFQVDFELAAIAALREIFPECEVFGCMFHYAQALNKKAQETFKNGLLKNEWIIGWLSEFRALPFLPPELALYYLTNVIGVVSPPDELRDACPLIEDLLKEFCSYYAQTWIKNPLRFGILSHYGDLDAR
jgi:hypothetical protein